MNEFHQMCIPPKLGTEFLQMFMRMEYALAASGEFADGDGKGVSAAWCRFANAVENAFCNVADKEFQAAIEFLLAEPVRKQALAGFGPLFLDPSGQKQTECCGSFAWSETTSYGAGRFCIGVRI
jgi:hypothetical protein